MSFQVPPESAEAVARVRDRLPAPTHCRFCGGPVNLCCNSELYGRPYGDWHYGYFCGFCTAYVGTHPNTHIPLGFMATAGLRKLRSAAHREFDPIWRGGFMKRGAAYRVLAKELDIPKHECHISWFDADDCERAIAAAKKIKRERGIK